MRLIERGFYLNKLKDVMGTPDIKVITGVRRSGKSKLLEAFMAYVQANDPAANIIPFIPQNGLKSTAKVDKFIYKRQSGNPANRKKRKTNPFFAEKSYICNN